jgi:ectoine hydroxylase-related dioxygenase (phytanoyl-CoA dioxygenase family)
LHNDLMAVLPEPWLAPYGAAILLYLDDTDATNGATRYLPGSHLFTKGADATPADLRGTKPLEAPAGSIIAIDGRLWHTSGANHTADRDRRVLISFYVSSFIRTQYNWNALLSDDVRAGLSPRQRALLGLDDGNMAVRLGYDAFRDTKQGIDPHAVGANDR